MIECETLFYSNAKECLSWKRSFTVCLTEDSNSAFAQNQLAVIGGETSVNGCGWKQD